MMQRFNDAQPICLGHDIPPVLDCTSAIIYHPLCPRCERCIEGKPATVRGVYAHPECAESLKGR